MQKWFKNRYVSSEAIQPVALIARTPLQPSVDCLDCILGGIDGKINAHTQRLYAFMHQIGLDTHMTLGNILASVLMEVGNMQTACEVFERVIFPDEHCWNSLITRLVKHSEFLRALSLYHGMQGVRPCSNGYAYVAFLKACTELNDVNTGCELHAEISSSGLLKRDVFVGNALVDMYVKCGFLSKAREVFDKLPLRDVVTWTSMIGGYAQHQHGEEALDCYQQMQLEGFSPNAVTYVCSLKACGILGAIDKGYQIHFEISRKGLFLKNLFVGSALVDMYAKCGALAKAQEIFDSLPTRDLVSWNALIAGYAQYEHGEKAIACYKKLQIDGFSPDAASFVSILKACGSSGATEVGEDVHHKVAQKGLLGREVSVGNALIDMYAKCGLVAKAQGVFNKLSSRDEVSWNALIAGYVMNADYEKALDCINHMQQDGFSPSDVTLVFFLKACGNINDMCTGEEIHAEVVRKYSIRDNHALGSALVDMYAKCGSLVKAQEVFDKILVRNVILWTVLIAGYVHHEYAKEALNCLEKMQLEGFSPNAVTYACGLRACGIIGATDKGRELHAEIFRNGLCQGDVIMGNSLVDMYAKVGFIAKAKEAFDELPERDTFSWNALISGYAQLGDVDMVFQAFEKLKLDGKKPDLTTFMSILSVCNTMGMWDVCQTYFEAMHDVYGISPTIEHHTCMIDLFSRAGQLEKAVALVRRMPLDPDLVVWRSILDACQKWGNLEIGKNAFENAV